jgi:hypothetical protein
VKYPVICSLLFCCFLSAALADTYVGDVPQGHYAYDAVYDLIRQGITGGFPDGTYRGDKLMTRFELAAFIAKFSRSRNLANGTNEKLVAELGSEISLLKYTRDKERRETRCFSDLTAEWRGGSSPTASGTVARYRWRGGVVRQLSENSYFQIDLDTMDSGWNGAQRDLASSLLDLEGGVSWETASLRVTSGPGEVLHQDGGLFPAENKTYYRRPWRALYLTALVGRNVFDLNFISRSSDLSGRLDVAEISGKASFSLAPLKLAVSPRFFYDRSGGRDLRLELSAAHQWSTNLNLNLLVGLAKSENWPHGLYLAGGLALADCLKLTVQRVGSQYRETYHYNIFDVFDRDLPDGSTNVGLELKKDLTADLFAAAAYDYTGPAGTTIAGLTLGRKINESADWSLLYQAGADSRSLGLKFDFRL